MIGADNAPVVLSQINSPVAHHALSPSYRKVISLAT
jgi:hypothetical protein